MPIRAAGLRRWSRPHRVILLATLGVAAMVGAACGGPGSGVGPRVIAAPMRDDQAGVSRDRVPPAAQVVADRDELLAVLDSLYSHYSAQEKSTTRMARSLVISSLLAGTVGATSTVLVNGDRNERKVSQGASALAALFGGIATEFQLTRQSSQQRACVRVLYHAVSDVRLRYGEATLPASDSAWTHYVAFKDSIDRNVQVECE